MFASVSEETTAVPYVDPLYEEYDYADCMSIIKTASYWDSFIHNAGLDHWHELLFVPDCPSTVAAKKQEEEEERARKEKAERGILIFWKSWVPVEGSGWLGLKGHV